MLKREIKRNDLILLFINSTIGAGIFGLPSKIFQLSGFYSLLALLVCAIMVFVLVLVFAEVASKFDKTGGPYLYILSAFGRIPSFIIGWIILITRISTYAALVNLLVIYLAYFFPELEDVYWKSGCIIFITLLFTAINYIGVKSSTLVNNTLAIAKLFPLIIFVMLGLFFINTDLINTQQTLPNFSDFSTSVLILIFAFTGFEAVLVNTGEIQNPSKNIPFALITSIGFVAIFYGLIQFVSMASLPTLASSEKPITEAAQLFMGPYGALLITFGAVVSISGTLNAVMLIGSRVPYALSEEGQFPKLFGKLHPKYQTPAYSLLIFSGVTLAMSLGGSFIYSVSISVISKVLIFLMVSAAMIKLRLNTKETKPYFKLPYGYIFASLGILISIILLISSKSSELIHVLIAIVVGIVLFIIFKLFSKVGK